MTSPGLTVRPDLSEDQLIRLIVLSYGNRPRNWRWLSDWAVNRHGYYDKGTVTWHVSGKVITIPKTDTEAIVRFYEDQANWLNYTEYDMAAA